MKTLTELSGTLVRAAAAAIDEVKRSLPPEPAKQAKDVKGAPPAAEPGAAEPRAAEAAAADASAPGARAEAPAADASAPEARAEAPATDASAPAEAAAEAPAAEASVKEVPPVVLEAVGKATGISGDRLSMLCNAVEAVGGRARDVRLVRVFGVEEPVRGAKTIGGHQYVVDMMPQSMKQVVEGPRDDEGGRGRGRGRGGRGGGRPGGGSGGGEKGAATGGFSMDALREDRRKERGPGGGGFRRGGGTRPGGRPSRPPGGGSGGPPSGGAPKA